MRIVPIIAGLLIMLLGQTGIVYGESGPPAIASGTGIVIDSSTGGVLYQKNKDMQAFPASLTKVMTAILLEENAADGEWMTASKKATLQEASNSVFNLKVGEKMQKEEALKALLVISANDVATMIAEHIGGDEAGFAELMNKRAASIGMVHTHFVTPNGLHDPQHYTTANDLALLAKGAMKYPAVMEALGTQQTVVKTDQRQVQIKDRTSLVFHNPLALGGKTGFTNQAHNTLLEYMKKDNKTVIAVVMKSTRDNEYRDVQTIGDYGLDRIDIQHMWQKGEVVASTIFYGNEVQGALAESYALTGRKDKEADFTYKTVFTIEQGDKDSIAAGEVIGSFQIMEQGTVLAQLPLVSTKQVHRSITSTIGKGVSQTASKWLLWAPAGVVLLIAIVTMRVMRKRKRRKILGVSAGISARRPETQGGDQSHVHRPDVPLVPEN